MILAGFAGCTSQSDTKPNEVVAEDNSETTQEEQPIEDLHKVEAASEGVEPDGAGYGVDFRSSVDSVPAGVMFAAFEYKFSSIPRVGFHNICLDVDLTAGATSDVKLSINKFVTGGVKVVQSFNLFDSDLGVYIRLKKSGSDTILVVEAASKKLSYYQDNWNNC